MKLSFKNFLAIILVAFLLFAFTANSQNAEWLNYTNGKNVTSLATEGNYMWVGTIDGGLVRINRSTFAMNFYNKTNSNLQSNTVLSVAVDGLGNKWLGTYKGLFKFNGVTWSMYNVGNSGIPSDTVTSIKIDNLGNKWLVTPNAVAKFDSTNWTIFNNTNSGIQSYRIFTLGIDPSNNLWVGGEVGLDYFNGTTWKHYAPFNSGIADFSIISIGFRSNGQVFAGTNSKGVSTKLFSDTLWSTYNTDNSSLPSNQVKSIHIDASNSLWFGTPSGLAKLASSWTVFTTANSLIPDNNINAISEDGAGIIWVATPDSLGRLAGTVWTIINPSSYALPDNRSKTIAMDLHGSKWIASYNSGVFKYDANTWTGYKYSASGLASNNVNFIGIDGSNNKWFCTDSGLSKFTDSTWLTYKRRNSGIPSDSVTSIAFEGNTIWVGTAGFGLAKFNGTTWTKYTTTNSGIGDDNILSVLIDSYGNKWIGTATRGVTKFDGTNWTVWETSNSIIPSNAIRAIALEGNKKWFATANGVASFDDINWAAFTPSNSPIPANNITCVGIESNGVKWFSTMDNGFIRFDGTAWSLFNKTNSPLDANKIDWLLVDPSGNKWLATDGNGLMVYRLGGLLPTVSTMPIQGPYCVDAQVLVNYYTFGSSTFVNFGVANVFTAQLSNSVGSFATAVNIGTTNSQSSGLIATRLPKTLPFGTGYRIRVVSSNPPLINGDDGKDFTIYDLPKPAITGSNSVCSGGVEKYKTTANPGVAFNWNVTGGTISGLMTDSVVTIVWGAKGNGSVKLIQTTPAGCKDSISLSVFISSKPPKIIYGDTIVCSNRYEVYTTAEDSTLTNEWVAVGGTVENKPFYNNIRILWGLPGVGKLKLIQTTASGCKDSITINVRILLSPSTSFTGPDTVKFTSTKTYQTPTPPAGVNNKWYVDDGGTINGSSTGNTVSITWGLGKVGTVKLVQTTVSGCKDSAEKSVFIYERVQFTGKSFVCENKLEDYYSTTNLEADCKWEVTGGTALGSVNQKILNVTWGNSGKGSLKLIQTYKSSGYKDSLTIQIQINAKPAKPRITEKNGTLTSDVPSGNQWYYNGVSIKGATNQSHYTGERSGTYTVLVSDSIGCTGDMSDAFNFVSGVEEITESNSDVRVYPNPTNGFINISINRQNVETVNLRLVNLLGNDMMTTSLSSDENSKSIDLNSLADGVYILHIQIGSEQFQKRIILNK